MKVAIATDHNGVEQKSDLIFFLGTKNIEVLDMSKDNNPVDDYPDFAFRVANAVANGEADLGILMCGTGIGMSIAANKVKGVPGRALGIPFTVSMMGNACPKSGTVNIGWVYQ